MALKRPRELANSPDPHLLPGVVTEPLPHHNSTSAAAGAGGKGAPAGPLSVDYSHGVQFFQRAAPSLEAPLRPRIHKIGSSTTVNPAELVSTKVTINPSFGKLDCHRESQDEEGTFSQEVRKIPFLIIE